MKKTCFVAIALVLLIAFSGIFMVASIPQNKTSEVYVGVTYCGNSVDEAKQLIESNINVRYYTSWKEGIMTFKDEKLADTLTFLCSNQASYNETLIR